MCLDASQAPGPKEADTASIRSPTLVGGKNRDWMVGTGECVTMAMQKKKKKKGKAAGILCPPLDLRS